MSTETAVRQVESAHIPCGEEANIQQRPARSDEPVADDMGSMMASWAARPNWQSLPSVMWRSVKLTWRACPRTVVFSLLVGVVNALAFGSLYLVLQRGMSSFTAATTPADILAGPLRTTALVVLLLLCVRLVTRSLEEYSQWRMQAWVFRETDMGILRAALRVPLIRFEESEFFPLLQRCSNSSGQISMSAPRAVQVLSDVATIVAITVALSLLNVWIVVAAAAAAIPGAITEVWAARMFYRVEAENAWPARLRYYISNVVQGRAAAAEIRAFGLERTLEGWSGDAWHGMHAARDRARRQRILLGVIGSAAAGVITVAGVLLALSSGAGVGMGGIVAVALGLMQLKATFSQMFERISQIADASLYLGDLERLRSWMRREKGAGATKSVEAADRLDRLSVSGVSFAYPGASRNALADVSISIGRGELVALVGRNGSGKTTLAKVVAGLYVPESGRVYWNSDEYECARDTVRGRTTMQFQDPTRWCFTVRENVWFGDTCTRGSDDGIVDSLRDAGASGCVDVLPSGIDTRLGRELGPGADLSGGEWQRLALARCFYRDSDLVILDEATSSMDAVAESQFLESIRSLLADRAALLITHRFANLRLADRIYVLDGGRIVEQGSHDELLRKGGIYHRLHRLQVQNL